ncbi:hypothetical protein L6164_024317 [Bauhinia variegata]|uniref:Uncharacterized protein n=1 Tax=Bauhinia variegata TaxID=167791 RepID=A0ACB9LXF1_BAUVA|nr:hypothetical protein L6164_024317 [Bauhinia variegata]
MLPFDRYIFLPSDSYICSSSGLVCMMDPSNDSPSDELKAVLQNGVHEEPTDGFANDVDFSIAEITETAAPNGNVQNVVQLDNTVTKNSSMGEIIEGSNNKVEGDNVIVSKEEEVKITDQAVLSKATKGPAKGKNANPKGASLREKSKDNKDEEAPSAPNGTLALNSRTRQPNKIRSFDDRKTQLSKQSGKSDVTPFGAPMEKTKPKSLKEEPLGEVQAEQSSDTTAEDAKPLRVGTLPNYGFSFKCDERAERRKEFYTKLEEKIHAKEVEKSNLQAKTKETQEAEIKMLRKTLAFKATPMPSFYQEPPPPKVELKKIPTTRAKSPKLGRRKSSTNAESEGNTRGSAGQVRLSLGEKMSESIPTKGVSPVHLKKPQRRSLPSRLPLDMNSSSNSTNAATSSKAMKDEKTSLSRVTSKDANSNSTGEEKTEMVTANEENSLPSMTNEAPPLKTEHTVVPLDESSEMKSHTNGDRLVEKQPQLPLVQEPIAAEH